MTWKLEEKTLGTVLLKLKTVTSWRMKRGLDGWRIAQMMRMVMRRMKLKIRSPAQQRRILFRRLLWPCWPQSFEDMIKVALEEEEDCTGSLR